MKKAVKQLASERNILTVLLLNERGVQAKEIGKQIGLGAKVVKSILWVKRLTY